jgi:hypothetical protein
MSFQKTGHNSKRALAICLLFGVALFLWGGSKATTEIGSQQGKAGKIQNPIQINLQFQGKWEKRFELKRGESFELSVSLPRPSGLP